MLTEWIITLSPEERERTAFHESGVRRDTAPPRSPAAGQEKHGGNQEWRCQAPDAAVS
jgi:hypothetical protein